MWDNLLVQIELTINLLRQATLNPRISAWEYYNGAFDYTATPLGPIGCKIMIHTTSNKGKSWDQRRREGFSVVPALQHYQCIQSIDSKTKPLIITDTDEYLHKYLTQPHITAEYRMTHAKDFLTAALKDVPTSIFDSQLAAIEAVREIFTNGKTIKSTPHKTSKAPFIPRQEAPVQYRTPTSKGGQENQPAMTSITINVFSQLTVKPSN